MKDISYRLFQNDSLLSIILYCVILCFVVFSFFKYVPLPRTVRKSRPFCSLSFVSVPKATHSYTRKDYIYLGLIATCYAVVSFYHLGTTSIPSTTWQPVTTGQSVIFHLPQGTRFDAIYTIYGEGDNNANFETWQLGTHDILLEGSNDLENWQTITTITEGSIYQYHVFDGDWDYSYVRLTSSNLNDTLSEISFKTYGEESFLAVEIEDDKNEDSAYPASLLIDEQEKMVLHATWYDESYFDEVYHPRNAWEIANGQYMYSSVHPLLGTCLMALSVKILGFSPFSYRLPGVLFGILLVPLFYKVLKLLFAKRKIAVFGTLLFSCDFMHITTSRIGTLEPMSVFWILLMFRYLLEYYQKSFYFENSKKLNRLLLKSGISMGLGIATKWTACYSAVGLAILLFSNWFARIKEYRKAKELLKKENITISEKQDCIKIVSTFPCLYRTIGACFLYFLGIPVLIYFLSYLPCHVQRDGYSITGVIEQIKYMYQYHINLKATHPYQSTWYQWILDIRPIWYYGKSVAGKYYSIACFNNPILCWSGFIAFGYTVVQMIRKKSRIAFAIIVGYLTALLPWVFFVKRCVFAYHFYPTSLFMILCIAYIVNDFIRKNAQAGIIVLKTIAILTVIVLILFLPVVCGHATTSEYIHFLEWLPTWYFG